MTIDKKKVEPAGIGEEFDLTAMNVVGKEKEKELVIAETDGKKQFGEKSSPMSTDLEQGVTIKASEGGKGKIESNKEQKGYEI